jgi:hypothetical protein
VYREARSSYGRRARERRFCRSLYPTTAPLRRGTFTGPQMDPELRLLDLVRRDWWVLVIVLCIIWAIECHLEGNSVIETIEAPLLVVAWVA